MRCMFWSVSIERNHCCLRINSILIFVYFRCTNRTSNFWYSGSAVGGLEVGTHVRVFFFDNRGVPTILRAPRLIPRAGCLRPLTSTSIRVTSGKNHLVFYFHWDLNLRRHGYHPFELTTRRHPWVHMLDSGHLHMLSPRIPQSLYHGIF